MADDDEQIIILVKIIFYLTDLPNTLLRRTLRTDVVHCATDAEFLCKLHCLRLALQLVFKDAAVWAWFVDAGRQVLTDMLLFADKVGAFL